MASSLLLARTVVSLTLITVGLAVLAGAGQAAVGSPDAVASFTGVRGIPGPVTDVLGGGSDAGGPAGDSTTQAANGSDEALDRHGAQPAGEAGPSLVDRLGAALWAVPLGALALTALAAVRLRSSTAEASPARESTPPSKTQDPSPEEDGEPFLAEAPPPGVDGVLELGQACVAEGDYEAAAGWFETAIELRPRLAVAHFCLGVCLERMGRDEEALEALGAAEEIGGTTAAPAYRQARILARKGRDRESLQRLSQALTDEPELADDAVEDPIFDHMQDHPRFLAMVGRL